MGEIPALAALWVLQLPQAELAPPQGHPCRDSLISFSWKRAGSWEQHTAPSTSGVLTEVQGHCWRDQQGALGMGPSESISCTGRPHQPLENGMRAKVFLYPPDKSTELPGI